VKPTEYSFRILSGFFISELYHKDTSPAARAVYTLLRHLNLDVTLKYISSVEEMRTAEFLALNPAHQIPILIDNGLILTESRAILCYLINQYSPDNALYPVDPRRRAQIDRMLYFDGTNFFPALKSALVPRIRKKVPSTEEHMEAVRNSVSEMIALKGSNKFLTGSEVSLADLSVAASYQLLEMTFPEEAEKLKEWYSEVEIALPVMKLIVDKVDFSPLAEMLKV